WTPGTHIFLGESVLANLHQLPTLVADLLRAFPYDYLYGNIAADTSMAKKYAPVGRHCHAWHVGQEIFDLAPSDPLRAFGLGYLSHLAADTIAHNFFVPRQLVLTSSTVALGHSYWESRFETHLGDAYAREARDVILKDHAASDAHLDEILSPTLFSVRTNRRLFRGMVHLTESQSWQWVFQVIAGASRWDLAEGDIENHMAVAFEYIMGTLGADAADAAARRLDPAGEKALGLAKRMQRQALREGARRDAQLLLMILRVRQRLRHHPVRRRLRLGTSADDALIVVGDGATVRQHDGVLATQDIRRHEPLALLRRQLRQLA